MFKTLFFSLFLFSCFNVFGQNEYSAHILKDATKSAQALVSQNADKVIESLPPKVINMAGGIEFMKEQIQEQFTMFNDQKMKIVDATFGEPGPVYKSGTDLHCVLSQTTKMTFNGQDFEQESNLFATSFDEGLSWHFLDLNKYDKESLLLFFPDLNTDMKIPGKVK